MQNRKKGEEKERKEGCRGEELVEQESICHFSKASNLRFFALT